MIFSRLLKEIMYLKLLLSLQGGVLFGFFKMFNVTTAVIGISKFINIALQPLAKTG